MDQIIHDDKAFQVRSNHVQIGESATGYTLYSSTQCKNPDDIYDSSIWAAFSSEIPANFQHLVIDVAYGTWFRLVGNVGDVKYTC